MFKYRTNIVCFPSRGIAMIVGERKQTAEIIDLIGTRSVRNILVVGCDSCVSVCLAGGKDEVNALVRSLNEYSEDSEKGWSVSGLTLKRQCERAFEDEIADVIERNDVIVSLGCGVGAQMLSENFSDSTVIPGINTSNMGAPVKRGVFKEKCMGCGDCTIHRTAGICALARCSKSLQNGPCGGSHDGKCEIDPETDCAWHQIFIALKDRGELSKLCTPIPPKDWSKSRSGGSRTVRTKGE